MLIPDNFTEFLLWFKEVTETSWAAKKDVTQYRTNLSDAKWVGLNDLEIDGIEKKFKIKFPPDHREFLKILHTVNVRPLENRHFFFNWVNEENIVVEKLNWPYSTIAHDNIWLESWGKMPNSTDGRRNAFVEWYHKAPRLIPLFGHRYIVSEPCITGNPVLSVWGSDTIIYGWDLKHYLLQEFNQDMPAELFQRIYDEEEDNFCYEYKDEILDFFDSKWLNSNYDNIPYWGELIKYSEGSWKYETRKG